MRSVDRYHYREKSASNEPRTAGLVQGRENDQPHTQSVPGRWHQGASGSRQRQISSLALQSHFRLCSAHVPGHPLAPLTTLGPGHSKPPANPHNATSRLESSDTLNDECGGWVSRLSVVLVILLLGEFFLWRLPIWVRTFGPIVGRYRSIAEIVNQARQKEYQRGSACGPLGRAIIDDDERPNRRSVGVWTSVGSPPPPFSATTRSRTRMSGRRACDRCR